MEYVAVLSLFFTVLGVVLQLRDVFPNYREIRKSALLIVFGIFIGSIIAVFFNFSFSFQVNIHPFILILIIIFCFATILEIILFIASLFIQEKDKHEIMQENLGSGIIVCLGLLVAIALAFGFSKESNEQDMLTANELMILSNYAESNKNYDKAIKYLEITKSKYKNDDPRWKSLGVLINDLKEKSIKEFGTLQHGKN